MLKSVHEGAGETIQSKSMGGHVGHSKVGGCQYVVAKNEYRCKTVCQNMRNNANVETHILIRLQLNCIQSLSLVMFGIKLEWICAAYPIQMKDLYMFVLL